jgi:S-disulfanyl-L-cysteine oxidoreductase SoxD
MGVRKVESWSRPGAGRWTPALLLALVALIPGCGSEHPELDAAVPPEPGAAISPATLPDTLPVRASEPAAAPLGIGQAPTEGQIEALDIDVLPDGTGLPPGQGTAEEAHELYRAQCASCHGLEGEGTPAGYPLVGRNPGDVFDFWESIEREQRRTIGNWWPYAPTLFGYTRRAMPLDDPGSLSDAQVYALTAWMLWKNGLIEADEVMDATSLPEVEMPNRDRFIPDDRFGGVLPGYPRW